MPCSNRRSRRPLWRRRAGACFGRGGRAVDAPARLGPEALGAELVASMRPGPHAPESARAPGGSRARPGSDRTAVASPTPERVGHSQLPQVGHFRLPLTRGNESICLDAFASAVPHYPSWGSGTRAGPSTSTPTSRAHYPSWGSGTMHPAYFSQRTPRPQDSLAHRTTGESAPDTGSIKGLLLRRIPVRAPTSPSHATHDPPGSSDHPAQPCEAS